MKDLIIYTEGKFKLMQNMPEWNPSGCHSSLQCDNDSVAGREQFCGCWNGHNEALQACKDSALEIVNIDMLPIAKGGEGRLYWNLKIHQWCDQIKDGDTFELPEGLGYEVDSELIPDGSDWGVKLKCHIVIHRTPSEPSLNNTVANSKKGPEVGIKEMINPFETLEACNWTEDYPHENGNYINTCVECKMPFKGHKRRPICKMCNGPNWSELSKMKCPEDNKHAHAGCWSQGEMVGFARCMVKKYLPLQKELSEFKEEYNGVAECLVDTIAERNDLTDQRNALKEENAKLLLLRTEAYHEIQGLKDDLQKMYSVSDAFEIVNQFRIDAEVQINKPALHKWFDQRIIIESFLKEVKP